MSRRIARLLVTAMAVGFIVVGSGCATTDDQMFKLRVEVKEAKGAAERAEKTAHKADSAANAASRVASEALNAAEAAHACCRANTEKIIRAESKLGS